MEALLTVVFGLPALVALLILPFIIIYTPFRWRKQTQRLDLIETRLGEVERSHNRVTRDCSIPSQSTGHAWTRAGFDAGVRP